MKKLLTTSKLFSAETISAMNSAEVTIAQAIALACIDAAKVGTSRDGFLVELRKVSRIPCGTSVASVGLRTAKADGATLDSVTIAIQEQYDKDRIDAQARRKKRADKTEPA